METRVLEKDRNNQRIADDDECYEGDYYRIVEEKHFIHRTPKTRMLSHQSFLSI